MLEIWLFIYPSPFIPLPLKRGEGRVYREGASFPLLLIFPPSVIKRNGLELGVIKRPQRGDLTKTDIRM